MDYKAHDEIEVTYFPQELIDLQAEMLHQAHIGLWARLNSKHGDELKENADNPMEQLIIIAAEIGIVLDGEYTIGEVASKILKEMIKERKRQELGSNIILTK